jgi:hypothetical protein
MASLRKKPAEVASVEPLTVAVDTDPLPPKTVTPPSDEAGGALKQQLAALQQAEQRQQAVVTAETRRREWLASNPLAQKHYQHLGAFHNEAVQSGLVDTSPQYFEHMENRLAALHHQLPATVSAHLIDEMQARTAQERTPPPAPERQRTNIVSAPVSREVPSGGSRPTKMNLTREEVEIAAAAGVTPTEYARQKQRLMEAKANGQYLGQP